MTPGAEPHEFEIDAELLDKARRVATERGDDLDDVVARALERFVNAEDTPVDSRGSDRGVEGSGRLPL